MSGRFEQVNRQFEIVSGRFEQTNALIAALNLSMEQRFNRATIWALGLYIALAGTLLTVMARGFKWF